MLIGSKFIVFFWSESFKRGMGAIEFPKRGLLVVLEPKLSFFSF